MNDDLDDIDLNGKKTRLNEIKPECKKPIIWKSPGLQFLEIIKSYMPK
ncbi:MAG: hypothetical protein MUO82_03625 [Candidatus Thermoplasmatota archaeon]|nr:hypothetical protein [Candidatus Thermoplasmatota archaeon]